MAATVEGTFLLFDRASPELKDIRRNALEADAAVAGLGRTLDGVGSRRQAKQLETYSRQTRVAGNEERALGRDVERTTGGLRQHERQVGRTRTAWRGLISQFKELRLLAVPLKFMAMGAAVGYLVQGVGALGGGLVSLLPRIADLAGLAAPAVAGIFGLASGMIAVKLATGDLSKALAGNKLALKALTPEGKTFLATLKEYKPVLKGIREQAQKGLFPALTATVARAASAAPAAGRIVRRGGAAVGGAALTVVRGITKEGNLGDIEQLAAQGDQMLRSLARDFVSLLGVVLNFGMAARPFTRWLTMSIEAWTRQRLAISQFNRDSGKTAAMLERTKTSIKGFVALTKDLWGAFRALGQAARPVGDDLWRSTDKAVRAWRLAFESPEGMLKNRLFFAHIRDDVHAIFRLVGALSRALLGLTGEQNGFVRTTDSLTAAVPSIEKLIGNLTRTFGPTLAATLKTLADVLGGASGWVGPWNILLTTINGILKVVDRLTHGSSAFGGILKDVFAVALISRFLVKLGLLEKGWWRVALAARSAAAAEAGAGSAGVVGAPGRGLGGVVTGFGMSRRAAVAGEEGAFLSGGFGRALGLGAWLGRGRTGAFLSGAGKLAPLAKGLSVPLIAASIGASFLPGKAGTVGQSAAAGAGIGALAGSIVPGLGNLAGAGIGAALGGAYGLLKPGPSKSSKEVAAIDKSLTMGLSALGYYPTELGRLQAQLKLYQATAARLAGENSVEAQQQLGAIQQEIDARRQSVEQIKTEMKQRRLNANVSLGRDFARQLGGIFRAARKGGESKGQARTEVEQTGLAMLRDIPKGPGRVGLAKTLIEYMRQQGATKAELATLKAEVTGIEPKGVGILDPTRKVQGTPGERRGLESYVSKWGYVEGRKEFMSNKPTAYQTKMIAWLVAIGMSPVQATTTVMALDVKKLPGAAKAPKIDAWLRGTPGGKKIASMFPRGLPAPTAADAGLSAAGAQGLVRGEHGTVVHAMYSGLGKGSWTVKWSDGAISRLSKAKGSAFGLIAGQDFARGGRVEGASLRDEYQIGPNAWAGGGELVVNRHTERKADRMMSGQATLGGLVAGETRPHSAPLAASSEAVTFAFGGQTGPGRAKKAPQTFGYPLAKHGKLIGTPGVGTHSWTDPPNNWESDNAVDIATPAGTPVVAVAGGVIGSQYGPLGSSDPRMAGNRLHLVTRGNEFYYAHLMSLSVPPGASVLEGSPLGLSGVANGVAHLHFAQKLGSPLGIAGAKVPDAPGRAASAAGAPAASATPAKARAAKAAAAPGRYQMWEQQVAAIQGFPSGWGTVSGAGGMTSGAAAPVAAAPGVGPAPRGVKAIARGLFGAYGWGDPQFPPLDRLWTKESGWNVNADTRKSGLDSPGAKVYAYGIPQARPAEKMAASGADWRTNPKTQIAWGLGYISGRYGSPEAAWAHEVAHDSYARGGRLHLEQAGQYADAPTWAGWHAKGGSFTTDGPTVFGAGERGREHVSITPAGQRRTPWAPHVEVKVYGGDPAEVQAAVERALHSVASQLDLVGVDGEDGF